MNELTEETSIILPESDTRNNMPKQPSELALGKRRRIEEQNYDNTLPETRHRMLRRVRTRPERKDDGFDYNGISVWPVAPYYLVHDVDIHEAYSSRHQDHPNSKYYKCQRINSR